MSTRCVIGVDLGGTNVRAAPMDELGNALGPRYENPSHAREGTEAVIQAMASTILQAVGTSREKPESVGLAIPGFVEANRGLVRWTPNFGEVIDGVFRCWRDVPVRDPLAARVGLPIHMGNDANLAALGEYKFGSGRNSAKCLVMLTLGTGVGGGVVLSPASVGGDSHGPMLLLGGNHGGAELGHTCVNPGGVDCSAGSYGAIEGYCQRDSIIKRAIHGLNRGRASIIRDLVEDDLSKVTPRVITDAADQGDELAIEVWDQVGSFLGIGIGNMINVFAPDIFAIGGQISKAGEWLLRPARREARNVAIPALFEDAKIVQAEQVADAGLYGGAALALEAARWTGQRG